MGEHGRGGAREWGRGINHVTGAHNLLTLSGVVNQGLCGQIAGVIRGWGWREERMQWGLGKGGAWGGAAREGVHVMVRGKIMNKLVRLTAFAYSNAIRQA